MEVHERFARGGMKGPGLDPNIIVEYCRVHNLALYNGNTYTYRLRGQVVLAVALGYRESRFRVDFFPVPGPHSSRMLGATHVKIPHTAAAIPHTHPSPPKLSSSALKTATGYC